MYIIKITHLDGFWEGNTYFYGKGAMMPTKNSIHKINCYHTKAAAKSVATRLSRSNEKEIEVYGKVYPNNKKYDVVEV